VPVLPKVTQPVCSGVQPGLEQSVGGGASDRGIQLVSPSNRSQRPLSSGFRGLGLRQFAEAALSGHVSPRVHATQTWSVRRSPITSGTGCRVAPGVPAAAIVQRRRVVRGQRGGVAHDGSIHGLPGAREPTSNGGTVFLSARALQNGVCPRLLHRVPISPAQLSLTPPFVTVPTTLTLTQTLTQTLSGSQERGRLWRGRRAGAGPRRTEE
jgi:hypothetical protein